MNELKAVKALIEAEIISDYECEYAIEKYGSSAFQITFNQDYYEFNTIKIRVEKLDKEEPSDSKFSVCVYEDTFEEFEIYSYSVKELWKALLWAS